jgi:hypothetical protein
MLHFIRRVTRVDTSSVPKEIGPSKGGEDFQTILGEELRREICHHGCIHPDG